MKKSILLINGIHYNAVSNSALKMNKSRILNCYFRTLIVILLCFIANLSICSINEEAVLEAYELRVNGKVDEAKALLENIIKEDSANALAHFELARTLNYINMMGSEEADMHLAKAVKLEPNNVIFSFYNANICFLKAYIALETGGENAKNLITNSCEEFDNVLKLKPDYTEALMYLVEFYGVLPPELGGDKDKAELYVKKLEKLDNFYGSKARLVMLPNDTDIIKFWEDYKTKNGEDCKILKELGVAYLFNNDIENARKYFEKAIAMDNSQNIRLLDLARYHQMKVMQNREAANEELPKSKEYIEQYLSSSPEPIPPLKAYALGMLMRTEMFLGNQEKGEQLMNEAVALDPYFSRAFGIPSQTIFEPPTKINHHFQSFFSPF